MEKFEAPVGTSTSKMLMLLGLAVIAMAGAASAVDTIYWGTSAGAVRYAPLDGSGPAQDLYTGEGTVEGVAIDAANGKIYWSALGGSAGNAIRFGNLDGSGAAATLFTLAGPPVGMAIDPTGGKLYWGQFTTNAIQVGNLDGSGSPASLFTGQAGPRGVAIDPAGGKIYWANGSSPAENLNVGNLDGSGSATVLVPGLNSPVGVAVDGAAQRIYYDRRTQGEVIGNDLTGSSPQVLYSGEEGVNLGPQGVAIDPVAGKIYWGNQNGKAIRYGNLDGSGSAATLYTETDEPYFLAILRAPAAAGVPVVTGSGILGQPLSCSQGTWAPDLLGAHLYRAASSFAYQWFLDGSPIAMATTNTYTPAAAGSYTCRVTATNRAGSTSQTSAAFVAGTADLSITKTNGVSFVVPGTSTTYTIQVVNLGPTAAPAAVVTDTFPASCTSVSWTCAGANGGTCPGGGTGNLNAPVNLPATGAVTFSAVCAVSPAATGTLVNTTSVAPGAGVTDPNPANNSATDSDTLTPTADVTVAKSVDPAAVATGDPVTYTIVVGNAGPSDVAGVAVTDTFPIECQAALAWTCTPAGGATCTPAGTGDIVDVIDLPVGSTATYVATCNAYSGTDTEAVNTASAAVPAGVIDPDPANSSSSATLAINAFAIQEIPTLGRTGLVALLLLIGCAGFLLLRRTH